jgi:hypothetical protein
MASPEINRLIDNARIQLPGALDAAIYLELFTMMHEFFIVTNCWTEDINFDVIQTQARPEQDPEAFQYDIQPTMGTITRLVSVIDAKGHPVSCTMPMPGQIVLARSPDADQAYRAKVMLTVVDPASSEGIPLFPQWVIKSHFGGILDGLVGRMMMQPAKPYSSPSMAVPRLRRFTKTTSQAKVETTHGSVYGGQRWKFPRFR